MSVSQSISLESTVLQQEGMVVTDMDGDKVMLSIENGKYYNLGEVGGVIWDMISTPIEVSQVIQSLTEQFQVEHIQCEEHVVTFLESLLQEKLIQIIEVR